MPNPTPPIPGLCRVFVKWFKDRFGLNLYGGRWNFETGFYVGGIHITPETAKKLVTLVGEKQTPVSSDEVSGEETTNLVRSRKPRNKTPAPTDDLV